MRGVAGSSKVARRVRSLGSTLLALLTFLFMASAQVAAVRADLTDLPPDAAATSACADAEGASAWTWSNPEAAAYRRDVVPAPELALDASESERSEEYARSEDAAVQPARVRVSHPFRATCAGWIASMPWAARHAAPTALPRGPPSARR